MRRRTDGRHADRYIHPNKMGDIYITKTVRAVTLARNIRG